jgi:two-component system chemotaxis response regulator CheB
MTPTSSKIRVLVVDDSVFVRQALARMLGSEPDIEVVGQARDGLEGLEMAQELQPDVITLDVKMPRLDGLETLERLIPIRRVPVLLMSSLTQEGAEVTLRGLELGALDFVDKSRAQGQMNLLSLAEEVRSKIRALAGSWMARGEHAAETPPPEKPDAHEGRAEIVAIGASTGGPSALQNVLPRVPAGFAATILVVQHIPVGFTQSLAERLAARSAIPVREAKHGEILPAGEALIAPAGLHMRVERQGRVARISLSEEPSGSLHRPSVDELLVSVAHSHGRRALGIVLTGMGQDGAAGLLRLRRAGGRTLAESAETAVIYGMPKAALENGGAERSVPLHRVADEMVAACR